jgi:hypothetical protein
MGLRYAILCVIDEALNLSCISADYLGRSTAFWQSAVTTGITFPDDLREKMTDHEQGLKKRELTARQMAMVAVGGSIGVYAEIYLNRWAGFVTRYGYWFSPRKI